MVGDLRAGRVGSLRISYFASAGATWIPPVVATLVREFPQLRLDLRLFELAGDRTRSTPTSRSSSTARRPGPAAG